MDRVSGSAWVLPNRNTLQVFFIKSEFPPKHHTSLKQTSKEQTNEFWAEKGCKKKNAWISVQWYYTWPGAIQTNTDSETTQED